MNEIDAMDLMEWLDMMLDGLLDGQNGYMQVMDVINLIKGNDG